MIVQNLHQLVHVIYTPTNAVYLLFRLRVCDYFKKYLGEAVIWMCVDCGNLLVHVTVSPRKERLEVIHKWVGAKDLGWTSAVVSSTPNCMKE